MRFRSYNALWVFDAVARHLSFTAAAEELSQSKGSVSYQIAKLETDLGFSVFQREGSQISLTSRGEHLWHASQVALGQLDKEISDLQSDGAPGQIAVAMLTYFFSRWLSPRLVSFMEQHPELRFGLSQQMTYPAPAMRALTLACSGDGKIGPTLKPISCS